MEADVARVADFCSSGARLPIEAIYVFGWFAPGRTEHEGSDIDLLVVGELPGRASSARCCAARAAGRTDTARTFELRRRENTRRRRGLRLVQPVPIILARLPARRTRSGPTGRDDCKIDSNVKSSDNGSTRRSSASRTEAGIHKGCRSTLGGCVDMAVDEGPHQDRCSGRVRRRGPGDDHRRRRDLDDLACHPVLLGCARKIAPALVDCRDPRGHPPGTQDPHRGDEPEGVQVAVLRDRPQPPFSFTASGRWGRNRRRGTRDPAPGWRSRIAARGSSARCIAIMARICYHRSLGKQVR